MWLGVVPAAGLAVTDEFKTPLDLLVRPDELLRLPKPTPDGDFKFIARYPG